MKSIVCVIGALLILLGGCTAASPISIVPTATPTAAPTLAPRATATALPTVTPVAAVAATAVPQVPSAQQPFSTTLQVGQTSVAVQGLLYVPPDYGRDAQRLWPLIVFLHGSGERGDDVQQLTNIGLPQILQERSDLPFIVVSPQLPPGDWWNDKGELLDALLDQLEEQYTIDPQRI
jgi:predicted peptidase